jgi:PAS domain S-box-containing protein
MDRKGFFNRTLLPSLVAMMLFLTAMYLFVIPNYRENLLDKKRETIREITTATWSILFSLDKSVNENFSPDQAKAEAISIISSVRYGPEYKDYFWITDTLPRMIMHPWRPELNGVILSDFSDAEGKRFFVEITELVQETGDGYIDYKWQWKDDSLMIVPKLSYVKLFEPWGWIVGTGIYVDDVKREITALTRQVVWISFFITLLIASLIWYLARRNYLAGKQRQLAQQQLKDTLERYKKLVEASTDGVMMSLEGEIIYCNPYLLNLLGYSEKEIEDERFIQSLQCLLQLKPPSQDKKGSLPETVTEHKIRKKNNELADVIITRSEFEMHGKSGYIYTLKDVSGQHDHDGEQDLNMEKFITMADLMELGMFRCTLGRRSRFTILNKKLIHTLGYLSDNELKNLHVQELFNDRSERREINQAINNGTPIKNRLLQLKKADGSILPAMVSLFPVKDIHDKVIFCDGILTDAYEHLSRNSGFRPNQSDEHLSANVLLRPVKDYMTEAPMCGLDNPVSVASRLMTMRNADIILITGTKKEIVGILTHGDISRRLVSRSLDPSLPVGEVMSAPVISVTDKEMVLDAFTLMVQHKVSYVAVKSTKEGSCSGYISLLALSELRRDTPEFLINSIQKAQSPAETLELMKHLPRLIARLLETGTGAATTGKLISRISDTTTIKIIEESIAELGQPPVPFVFLVLGSEGRKEQTLATDQDNAIIYLQKNDNKTELQTYFLELGKIICTRLDQVGYPFCTGDVMAMNPQWCMSLQQATEKASQWINTPNPKELLNAGIFFDFRPIYGDFEIASELQKHCIKEFKDKSVFFYNLAQSIVSLKPPVNVLGQVTWETTTGGNILDIKRPVMAITGIIRFWSLKTGITARNSLERLDAFQTAGILNDTTIEEFRQALKYLMLIRIRNQLRNIEQGEEPSNHLPVQYLSEMDRTMLKRIFSTISAHLNRMGTEMRIG